MTLIWKPTQAECDRIKTAAALEGDLRGPGSVILEPGERYNTEGKAAPEHYDGLNIALISDDPEFNDTDLSDYGQWSSFRKGVRLTDDGRAIVDFYIRKRFDEDRELQGNVTVCYADGQIQRLYGYGNKRDY